MNKKINIVIGIKDNFRYINHWEKVGDMVNKKHVEICDNDLTYSLEYIPSKRIASYGNIHSIYELTLEKLERIICKNYKVVMIDLKNDESIVVMKKVINLGYNVIPLEDRFYIETDDSIEIVIGKRSIKSSEIIVIDDGSK